MGEEQKMWILYMHPSKIWSLLRQRFIATENHNIVFTTLPHRFFFSSVCFCHSWAEHRRNCLHQPTILTAKVSRQLLRNLSPPRMCFLSMSLSLGRSPLCWSVKDTPNWTNTAEGLGLKYWCLGVGIVTGAAICFSSWWFLYDNAYQNNIKDEFAEGTDKRVLAA